jgi:hypothetical protein
MNSTYVLRSSLVAAVVIICGCGGKEAPKTPLGAAPDVAAGTSESPPSGLTGEAKIAIDSGNMLFRLKAYDKALVQYSRSADLAPNEVAPLLGILMVADVTRNSKLATETLPRIRKIDPTMADSSAVSSHSKVMQAHPKGVAPPKAVAPPST